MASEHQVLLSKDYTFRFEASFTFSGIALQLRVLSAWDGDLEISSPRTAGRPHARFRVGRSSAGTPQILWLQRPHPVFEAAAEVVVDRVLATLPAAALAKFTDVREVRP